MPKRLAAAVVALAVAACAPMRGVEPVPISAADFRPAQIRQPALVVRLAFGGQVSDREREVLPAEYEGALLEGLNTRAVLAKDVQVVAGRDAKLDARAALDRARALGADHAIVVDVRVTAGESIFCRESRRPFRAPATVWSQTVQVLRTSDGATRLTIPDDAGLAVTDFDADCDDPRASRRLPSGEAIASAVARLLTRVVGP
ncbi:MAG: hypothetical protein AUH99_08510 [Candidatus Rokubacteria bacterium 13_2_20CM_2_70_11]|nr:MAG: hypothetical protein AUH99_08510 [Candidatus Rokubacteria bacterium 13_2_20CM_2_70_11]